MNRHCGPILVVEDDPSLREFLVVLLTDAGYEPVAADNAEEALRRLDGQPPSVALLDVNVPGTSGYATCRDLRRKYGDRIGIIFISGTRTESFDRVGGLMIGADDYVVKPFDSDELLARIERLATRTFGEPSHQVSTSDGGLGLTPREDEILYLLVDGLSQAEIAERLVVSPKTVATHIQRVLAKLGVRSRTQAVALVARERAAS